MGGFWLDNDEYWSHAKWVMEHVQAALDRIRALPVTRKAGSSGLRAEALARLNPLPE